MISLLQFIKNLSLVIYHDFLTLSTLYHLKLLIDYSFTSYKYTKTFPWASGYNELFPPDVRTH